MAPRRKILIFCNRYLGFTLLAAGGVLEDMLERFDVTLITPPSSINSIQIVTGGKCTIVPFEPKSGAVVDFAYNTLSDILAMTYGRGNGRQNRTGVLHRKAHLKLADKKGPYHLLRKRFIVWMSERAEQSRYVRKVLNWLFAVLAPKKAFISIIKDISPDLCIATTAGLGYDGVFFAAAKRLNIATLAMIQSWDRTASKGYPASHPDYCFVWNEAMAGEAVDYLDIPQQSVTVCGAPPWDKYLREHSPLTNDERAMFFSAWKLDPSKKLVFVALNGPATHGENLRLIRDIASANAEGRLGNAQVMFRIHPAYLYDPAGAKELEDEFARLSNTGLHMMHPVIDNAKDRHFIVSEEDRRFMHSMFRACDVTVSIMSTWMIESSIFDKPNICIEYGRYQTELYDFDLSEYEAEHIVRIYSYNAVYRVRTPEQMVEAICRALVNPAEKSEARQRLAAAETGPNKGRARRAYLDNLLKIIN